MTRKDIAILPMEPKDIKIGWTVREYCGTSIFKSGAPNIPLTNKDDLKVGDNIIVWGSTMEVKVDEYGELYGDSEKVISSLEFDTDDRHCWVSSCMVNKRGLANVRKPIIIG